MIVGGERRAECRRVAERIEGPRRHDLGRPGSRAGARPRTGEAGQPRRRGPVRGARELLHQRGLIPPITEHSRRRDLLPSTSCALGGAPTPGPSGVRAFRCPGLARRAGPRQPGRSAQIVARYSPPTESPNPDAPDRRVIGQISSDGTVLATKSSTLGLVQARVSDLQSPGPGFGHYLHGPTPLPGRGCPGSGQIFAPVLKVRTRPLRTAELAAR